MSDGGNDEWADFGAGSLGDAANVNDTEPSLALNETADMSLSFASYTAGDTGDATSGTETGAADGTVDAPTAMDWGSSSEPQADDWMGSTNQAALDGAGLPAGVVDDWSAGFGNGNAVEGDEVGTELQLDFKNPHSGGFAFGEDAATGPPLDNLRSDASSTAIPSGDKRHGSGSSGLAADSTAGRTAAQGMEWAGAEGIQSVPNDDWMTGAASSGTGLTEWGKRDEVEGQAMEEAGGRKEPDVPALSAGTQGDRSSEGVGTGVGEATNWVPTWAEGEGEGEGEDEDEDEDDAQRDDDEDRGEEDEDEDEDEEEYDEVGNDDDGEQGDVYGDDDDDGNYDEQEEEDGGDGVTDAWGAAGGSLSGAGTKVSGSGGATEGVITGWESAPADSADSGGWTGAAVEDTSGAWATGEDAAEVGSASGQGADDDDDAWGAISAPVGDAFGQGHGWGAKARSGERGMTTSDSKLSVEQSSSKDTRPLWATSSQDGDGDGDEGKEGDGAYDEGENADGGNSGQYGDAGYDDVDDDEEDDGGEAGEEDDDVNEDEVDGGGTYDDDDDEMVRHHDEPEESELGDLEDIEARGIYDGDGDGDGDGGGDGGGDRDGDDEEDLEEEGSVIHIPEGRLGRRPSIGSTGDRARASDAVDSSQPGPRDAFEDSAAGHGQGDGETKSTEQQDDSGNGSDDSLDAMRQAALALKSRRRRKPSADPATETVEPLLTATSRAERSTDPVMKPLDAAAGSVETSEAPVESVAGAPSTVVVQPAAAETVVIPSKAYTDRQISTIKRAREAAIQRGDGDDAVARQQFERMLRNFRLSIEDAEAVGLGIGTGGEPAADTSALGKSTATPSKSGSNPGMIVDLAPTTATTGGNASHQAVEGTDNAASHPLAMGAGSDAAPMSSVMEDGDQDSDHDGDDSAPSKAEQTASLSVTLATDAATTGQNSSSFADIDVPTRAGLKRSRQSITATEVDDESHPVRIQSIMQSASDAPWKVSRDRDTSTRGHAAAPARLASRDGSGSGSGSIFGEEVKGVAALDTPTTIPDGAPMNSRVVASEGGDTPPPPKRRRGSTRASTVQASTGADASAESFSQAGPALMVSDTLDLSSDAAPSESWVPLPSSDQIASAAFTWTCKRVLGRVSPSPNRTGGILGNGKEEDEEELDEESIETVASHAAGGKDAVLAACTLASKQVLERWEPAIRTAEAGLRKHRQSFEARMHRVLQSKAAVRASLPGGSRSGSAAMIFGDSLASPDRVLKARSLFSPAVGRRSANASLGTQGPSSVIVLGLEDIDGERESLRRRRSRRST